jgi:hypothetical protein
MEKIMRKTTDTTELTIDKLNLVSGGAVVDGATGSITFSTGTNGSSVSWPGQGGVWTMSSKDGLSWHLN